MKKNFKTGMKKTAAVVLAASMVVGANGIPVVTDTGYATVVEAAEADENGFVIEGTVLTKYEGTATEVVIPEGITEIGGDAFRDNANKTAITSITFPDTVVKIGARAFDGCTGLTYVELPPQLAEIGGRAFGGCTGITSIEIPKTLVDADRYIIYDEEGPFQNTNISTVTFEEGTTTIASYLFAGLTSLKNIDIPDTVTTIEGGAFKYSGLESIVIGENVTRVEGHAYANCTSAASLDLGANLEFLGGQAFYGCTGITAVEIPKSLVDADCYSIYDETGPFQNSGLTTVTFEDKITTIASHLFAGAANLKSIEIPDTVTTIERNAFQNSGLESITIGEYVTRIESGAFWECENLAEVQLNDYVEFLGQGAFGNCAKITSIHIPKSLVDADTDVYEKEGPFSNTSITEVTFEEGIEVIANNLFQSIPTLETIDIPSTVETVGSYAFKGCTALKGVIIPWSVFEIKGGAFQGCTALEAIHLPDNVDTLGDSAFRECTALTDVRLSERISTIEECVFYGDTALETITIPDSVTRIKESAFNGCTKLTNLDTTGSVSVIESQAFYNTGFEEFVVWEGLTELGSQAFKSCANLTKVVLPDSLAKIGNEVFFGCGELAEVTFGTGLTTISTGTFSDCGSLEKVIFPYGITEIKTDVFHNCTSLTEVTIPKTAETLVEGMFSYPKKITVYGVEGSAAETYAEEEGTNFEALTAVATGVALNDTDIVMYKGQEKRMAMNVTPVEFIDDVAWSSSNEDVVTVAEDGTVEAHNVGDAVVMVKVGDVTASCKITVMKAVTENTQKDRIAVTTKDINKEIKTDVATIKISENAVASPEAIVVRSEKLGNNDKADIFKQADDILKATEKYNTDTYALYDFAIMNQATGVDVPLEDKVEITIDVPGGMDVEKVVVARMKNVSVLDADAEEIEVLNAVVAEDGDKLTFETDTMGVFAVIETDEVTSNPGGDPTDVYMLGDVDEDKNVSLTDAQLALKAALKIIVLEGTAAKAADVDSNGTIALPDAQKILKVALKIESF